MAEFARGFSSGNTKASEPGVEGLNDSVTVQVMRLLVAAVRMKGARSVNDAVVQRRRVSPQPPRTLLTAVVAPHQGYTVTLPRMDRLIGLAEVRKSA